MPKDFDFNRSYQTAPSRQNTVWDYMASRDATIDNPWGDYSGAFDFDAMSKQMDDIFGGYESKINRNVFEDIGRAKKGAGSNLASRGITGGSIVDDVTGSVEAKINKGKYNALGDLGIGKAKSIFDLMETKNVEKLMTTQLGTGVDQFNVNSEFRKGQGLGNYDMNWANLDMARDNQPGFLEDIMSGLGDLGQFMPFIMKMLAAGPTGGASMAIPA